MTFAEIKAGRTYLKAGLVKASISCYCLFRLEEKQSAVLGLIFVFFILILDNVTLQRCR